MEINLTWNWKMVLPVLGITFIGPAVSNGMWNPVCGESSGFLDRDLDVNVKIYADGLSDDLVENKKSRSLFDRQPHLKLQFYNLFDIKKFFFIFWMK